MKKFWKKTEGFTLVELIVVIAILGILAGVGTVGYSGYIKKANMAADQQLASGVANILQLEHYADMNASGYVILSKDKAPSVEDKTISEGLVEVLETAFGDLGALKLKSDEWAMSNDMLAAALEAGDAVGNSSYVKNSSVNELLGNVQTVVGAANEVLGAKARDEQHMLKLLKTSLGTGYLDKAVDSGVIEADSSSESGYKLKSGTYTNAEGGGVKLSQDLQNQLSNMMVFSVAEDMKSYDSYTMAGMMLSGYNDDDMGDYNPATVMAAQYAFYKSYALDTGAQASFNKMNDAIVSAGNSASAMATVENALKEFLADNKEGLDEYIPTKGETVIMTNAEAVTDIMKGVGAVEGNYTSASALASGSLYTSGGVASDLTSYINVAGMDQAAKEALQQAVTAAGTNALGGMIITVGPGGVNNPTLN